MDSTIVTALAAGLGSLAGAFASIAATWISQRSQTRLANAEWQLRERESLYKEFIMEASRLTLDALTHSLEPPDQLVTLYGILSRIRLVSNAEVLAEAEDCCRRIVELYRQPNLTSDQVRAAYEADQLDSLKVFGAACRTELLAISSNA
jgi:hypothetical protein